MPFEDLLTPIPPKCKTCAFIANLEPSLGEEVRVAVAKTTYSDERLARGMSEIATEYNHAPGEKAIKAHREKGHAS